MADGDRRIVIISDTHLGRPGVSARSAEALRPLWADADELIVNGDVAELHDPAYRAKAARHVVRLQQLCDADGVDLTLLSGNHDPLLTDVRHLELRGGEIFLTHGDVLHPAISPWTASAEELRDFNQKALAMLDEVERDDFLGKLAAAQHAAHSKWAHAPESPAQQSSRSKRMLQQARKVAATLWYWHTLPRRAAAFSRDHAPDARFFIFGHIHRAGIWTIDGRHIINTGCYGFVIPPRAVVIERDTLTVRPVIEAPNGLYCFGNDVLARYELTAPSADSRPLSAGDESLLPPRNRKGAPANTPVAANLI